MSDVLFILFSCIFIYLSFCLKKAIKVLLEARLGFVSYLSSTPRWRNPAKCLSQLVKLKVVWYRMGNVRFHMVPYGPI